MATGSQPHSCPGAHIMDAGVAAGLAQDDAYFAALRADLQAARARLADGLGALGFGVVACEGTYFITTDFRPLGFAGDDVEFCRHLTVEAGVAAVPMSAFYESAGIDHFARPGDGLERALSGGRLRRNFQGYTDDAADVLLGIGASAISRYPQGYAQNASATARYAASVANGNLATARGHQFSRDDQSTARLIEQLMCDFSVSAERIANVSATEMSGISGRLAELKAKFPDALEWTEGRLVIAAESRPLTHLFASDLSRYTTN